MPEVRAKDLEHPDEVRTFPHGRVELFNMGGVILGRTIFEPGWHWAEHVKPIVGTASCEVHHLGIVLSGRLGTRMDDGSEYEIAPGSAYDIPPGHDGWVVGDEPWVTIDFFGRALFAQPSEDERILLSILFTDIVGSTSHAIRIGDNAWRDLLARFNEECGLVFERFKPRLIQGTGDGHMLLFDGAARALSCALALGEIAHGLGLEIRAGVHTGDVSLEGEQVRGVAVHEASRVMALAGAGEIFASSTTRALLSTSPTLHFASRGVHALKGIDGEREIFALVR